MLEGAAYRFAGLKFDDSIPAHKYAHDLGAPHAYLPPVMEANSYGDDHNRHGYDLINHLSFSIPQGGRARLDQLVASIRNRGGRVIVDWVPNHLSRNPKDSGRQSHRLLTEDRSVFDIWFDGAGTEHIANFFGLDILPKVRLEDRRVFEKTQRFFLNWAAENQCILRGDHYDGWQNPAGVIARLAELDLQLIAEHTPMEGENFPTNKTLLGETGYRCLDWLNRLIHSAAGIEAITANWWRWMDRDTTFRQKIPGNNTDEMLQQAKYDAAHICFGWDIERFRLDLHKIGHTEVTAEEIAQWFSRLEVVRTYFWNDRAPETNELFDLQNAGVPGWLIEHLAFGGSPFWQPIMSGIHAKGFEDRFLYQYTPIPSLCEVCSTIIGGSALSPEDFHERIISWSTAHPHSLVARDTHDAKRSAAVRACMAAVTHRPKLHEAAMNGLWKHSYRFNYYGKIGPHAQRFIFDTMLATWPISTDRLVGYFRKAFREAGINTQWVNPNYEWEKSVELFVREIVADPGFVRALQAPAAEFGKIGRELDLSQQLVGLMIPGTYALYNGEEGPDNRKLVDPDNREPADYVQLAGLLKQVKSGYVTPQTKHMALVYRTLQAQKSSHCFHSSPWTEVYAPAGCIAVRRGDLLAVCALQPDVTKDASWVGGRFAEDLLPEYSGQGLYRLC